MSKRQIILLIVCLLLAIVYGLIGYYDSTFYRMEFVLLAAVLVVMGALTVLLSQVIKPLGKHRINIFLSLCSVCFSLLIGEHLIDAYRPNLKIYIPEDYEGMVHLFPSAEKHSKVYIDEYGIGFIPIQGEYDFKVYHGSKDISNVLNEYGSTSLVLPSEDGLHYQSISLTCFEVIENYTYPESPWNQKHATCMELEQYGSLVKRGAIDPDKIYKETWVVEEQ